MALEIGPKDPLLPHDTMSQSKEPVAFENRDKGNRFCTKFTFPTLNPFFFQET